MRKYLLGTLLLMSIFFMAALVQPAHATLVEIDQQELPDISAFDPEMLSRVSFSGTATSWKDGDEYLITIDGVMTVFFAGNVMLNMPYYFDDSKDSLITQFSYSLETGWGSVTPLLNDEMIQFLLAGWGGWYVHVECRFQSYGDVSVEVREQVDSGYYGEVDWCELSLAFDLSVGTYLTSGAYILAVPVYIDDERVGETPWTGEVECGTHSVKVESLFYRDRYKYTFNYWEGGGTSNPRTVNIVSDMTLRAYYDKTFVNHAPNTPSRPSGPTTGLVDTYYTYSTSTTDPDGDNVRYKFYWSDGFTTTGYYSSGTTVSRSHKWSTTGLKYVYVKAQDIHGEWSGWSSARTVYISSGGGGCPILSVYDGTAYVDEGLLDIHNADGIDEIASHVLIYTPEPVEHRYLLRLTEHPQTHSHIDQVQLFATLTNGMEIKLPLVSAVHSEDGDVLWELRLSDDVRADTLGADHNDGTSEYIDLEFVAPEGLEIEELTFNIEGHNIIIK